MDPYQNSFFKNFENDWNKLKRSKLRTQGGQLQVKSSYQWTWKDTTRSGEEENKEQNGFRL